MEKIKDTNKVVKGLQTEVGGLKKEVKEVADDVKTLMKRTNNSLSEDLGLIEDEPAPMPKTNCTLTIAHFGTAMNTMHACLVANAVDGSDRCRRLKHHCGDQAWANFCAETCSGSTPGVTPAPAPYNSGGSDKDPYNSGVATSF